ncbi:hypothetical protein [Ehrlichia minasensis]|uniref:hypothetical protein n=1 Tax=Ehrlichia minasensis TaxID=1242993 RepID=UPI000AE8F336|nr:hypothetical protein [Ehrlichia minasensis]
MLLPHKLKVKAIYHHIDRSENIKELLYAYKKLIKIKKYLYKTKKISKKINTISIKKKLCKEHKKNNLSTHIKKEIKKEIRTLLMSTIAHEMDPVQRPGQTVDSNMRGARKFGRSHKVKKKIEINVNQKVHF